MGNKRIEELSLNHWQPLSTLFYDGWILRFADGYTKRANSISPIYGSTLDLDLKIAECEKIYSDNHLRPTFKMTPFVDPTNLDRVLEEKGYSVVDPTSVQTIRLDRVRKPECNTIQIEESIDLQWLNHFCEFNQIGDKNAGTMARMLSNIKNKKGFISVYNKDNLIACGFGVIEQEYIGLYDIVTDSNHRNKGIGEQMVLNLLRWGVENGAKHSYLAVVLNNKPALRLYEKIGYTEIYKYWYRVKTDY